VILEETMPDRHRSEQRRRLRFPAALRVIFHCDGKRYAATVVNISAAGALVRLSARPEVGCAFVVRCGSTTVTAEVVWIGTGHAGVSFARPLEDAALVEHINRSRRSLRVGYTGTSEAVLLRSTNAAHRHWLGFFSSALNLPFPISSCAKAEGQGNPDWFSKAALVYVAIAQRGVPRIQPV
jgi:hypothetical protein